MNPSVGLDPDQLSFLGGAERVRVEHGSRRSCERSGA